MSPLRHTVTTFECGGAISEPCLCEVVGIRSRNLNLSEYRDLCHALVCHSPAISTVMESISMVPAFALRPLNPAKILSGLSIWIHTAARSFGASEERQRVMVHYSGVWIDHRQAVIVSLSGSEPTVTRIESGAEKHVRSSSGSRQAGSGESHHGTPEDAIDRKFDNHLKSYYEEVAEGLKDAGAILVMGPGEARTEFQKHIKSKELLAKVVGSEKCDKMTDPQLVARVREYFASTAKTA